MGVSDEHPNYLNRTGFITPLANALIMKHNCNIVLTGISFFRLRMDGTGVDYRSATANTENHVYGRHEDDDDYQHFRRLFTREI